MEIIEVNNKDTWNSFIAKNNGSFLQSWEWGQIQKNLNKKIWRLATVSDNNIVNAILIIKQDLAFGKSYLFSPWAICADNEYQLFSDKIKEIAKVENAIFFRYEPMCESGAGDLQQLNFRFVGSAEPKDTLLIDLSKSEEELLKEMHPKTRYNIRLAERKGVKVSMSYSTTILETQFDHFWQLLQETYNRQGIKAYNKDYYHKILDKNVFQLYLARYENKIIVANLMSFFGNLSPWEADSGGRVDRSGTVTYLYGGSDRNFHQTMATSLIQWQAIKDAKAQGYKYYDFYGISGGDKKNIWAGITRFKKGFGGVEKHYVGAWDLIFSKSWYGLYKISRKFKYLVSGS